ncbi:AbrB/MazE/SpoVT family DNA-binding domain-containing protein [Micromonospora sp. C51]|nr:AbrB/MazE/SpoVT family DNA-binding domain-containing protein [Micromonospora sp. C51]
MAVLEGSGRLRDRAVVRALGWGPATRLDIRECAGFIVVRADGQGCFGLTGQGYVRLPAAVRHWCGIAAGDRLLLVADPAVGLLVVCPVAALDAIVGQAHATVLGGGVS